MKMDLYQCDSCENIYAVYPSIARHQCPYPHCQGETRLVAEGEFSPNKGKEGN